MASGWDGQQQDRSRGWVDPQQDSSRGWVVQQQDNKGWKAGNNNWKGEDQGWEGDLENRSRESKGQGPNYKGWVDEQGGGWRGDRGWPQRQENRSRGWDQQGVASQAGGPQPGVPGGSTPTPAPGLALMPQSRIPPGGPNPAAGGPATGVGVIPPGGSVYDLEYFANLPLYTHYKERNVALKYVRECCEQLGSAVLWFDQEIEVPLINHPKGASFTFDHANHRPWAWQQMVAQLHGDSMELVVQGTDGRSRGIVACSLQQTDQYDHKRHHADVKTNTAVADKMYYIWDFVLLRDDGTYVALHPNYSHAKIECKVHWPTFDGELPRTGKGGANGPGAFKHFIKKNVDTYVRFDANKPLKGKGKGKDASASSWQ